MSDKIEIKINDHISITAEPYDEFREISIGLEEDGVYFQDLAVVRQKYGIKDDSLKFNPRKYEVLVWSDENDEDYTDKFEIDQYTEKEKHYYYDIEEDVVRVLLPERERKGGI